MRMRQEASVAISLAPRPIPALDASWRRPGAPYDSCTCTLTSLPIGPKVLAMRDESLKPLRVNLNLNAEDAQHLATVMAMMPTTRSEHGVPVAITMTDAVRWALAECAERGKR